MAITRRCPLSCKHCSTNSTIRSEHPRSDLFVNFAKTFSKESHPRFLVLTGGEPLLRPNLVQELCELAHSVGTKVVLHTGLFFARSDRIPQSILKAIRSVDYLMTSLDIFHEEEVSRKSALRAIDELRSHGARVGCQVVGSSPEDPFLRSVIKELRDRFLDEIPILVVALGSSGRAKRWVKAEELDSTKVTEVIAPCKMVAWPVMTYSGNIVACCNQNVVDGPSPSHLYLGHAQKSTWEDIYHECRRREALKALRTFGPLKIANQFNKEVDKKGYCETCLSLSSCTTSKDGFEKSWDFLGGNRLESLVEAIQAQAFDYGMPGFRELCTLGYRKENTIEA